jgi:hypothetical protein
VCTRGSNRALLGGPSTSPLGERVAIGSVVGITLVAMLICFFSMAVSAHLSGWYTLTQQYRAVMPFSGRRWHLRAATFRSYTSYWLTLVIGGNRDGLYLAQFWPLSWTHPPLFIPWRDVQFAPRRWFEVGARSLLVGQNEPIRVSMSRRIVADLQGLRNEAIASA